MRRERMARVGTLEWVILAICVALVAGMLLATRLSRVRLRWAGRAANLRGQRGEREAERLLSRHGYRSVARQLRGSYEVEVGEERVEVALQADFLVERDGRRSVAEVKTGRHAPRFQHAETRRQLLEYQVGFGVESVLLVDVENGRLSEVRFPVREARAGRSLGGWVLLLVLGLSGLAWMAIRSQGQ